MKRGNKVVIGILDTRSELERALDALQAEGFRNEDVSVLMPQQDPSFGHEKASKAPEASAIGTGTGAVIGGTLGWLVGLGAIAAVPVLGPLIAAGPIMAALSGAAVGGALGGVTGALVGFGIPEYEAKRYESFVKEGGILISVHVDDAEWSRKAKDLLERVGARDISATTEESSDANRDESRRTTPSTYTT